MINYTKNIKRAQNLSLDNALFTITRANKDCPDFLYEEKDESTNNNNEKENIIIKKNNNQKNLILRIIYQNMIYF